MQNHNLSQLFYDGRTKLKSKVKGKVVPVLNMYHAMKTFLTAALDGGESSASHPGPLPLEVVHTASLNTVARERISSLPMPGSNPSHPAQKCYKKFLEWVS